MNINSVLKSSNSRAEISENQNRRALDQIIAARERFKESCGQYPSVIQVGEELFRRAYPLAKYPHLAEAIRETLVVPRKDICGEWAIVMPKLGKAA